MRYTRTALGLLTRQYRSVLKKCWLINVGLFALGAAGVMMPSEAEAGVLCYANDGTVKYSTDTTCPTGTTKWLMSLDGINSTTSATIGSKSIALGNSALATGNQSIALGYITQATGGQSLALGYTAKATQTESMALGYSTEANGMYSTALGSVATASGNSSTALGRYAYVAGTESTALGSYAHVYGYNSSALGNYARVGAYGADVSSSVALGYKSVTTEEKTISVGHLSTDKSSSAGTGTATFGSDLFRRIINVADGTGDHDAATVGQVKNKADKATSLSGYGITDAYTKTQVDTALSGKAIAGSSSVGTHDANAMTTSGYIHKLIPQVGWHNLRKITAMVTYLFAAKITEHGRHGKPF